MREQILSNCQNQLLHQHLVDSDLTSPQELGKKADKWVRTRIRPKNQDSNQKKESTKPQDKGGDKNKEKTSPGPQNSKNGGGSQDTSSTEKKPYCYACKQVGHYKTDNCCPKNNNKENIPPKPASTPPVTVSSTPPGSGSTPRNLGGFTVGAQVDPGLSRSPSPNDLVYETGMGFANFSACPNTLSKYRQEPIINGLKVEAFRDTGASITMVADGIVPSKQLLPGATYQVTNIDGIQTNHPMAVVSLSWGGVIGPKRVAVSPNLPVDCLLGNDLEISAWAEVEQETNSRMVNSNGKVSGAVMATAPIQDVLPEKVGRAEKLSAPSLAKALPEQNSKAVIITAETQTESPPEKVGGAVMATAQTQTDMCVVKPEMMDNSTQTESMEEEEKSPPHQTLGQDQPPQGTDLTPDEGTAPEVVGPSLTEPLMSVEPSQVGPSLEQVTCPSLPCLSQPRAAEDKKDSETQRAPCQIKHPHQKIRCTKTSSPSKVKTLKTPEGAPSKTVRDLPQMDSVGHSQTWDPRGPNLNCPSSKPNRGTQPPALGSQRLTLRAQCNSVKERKAHMVEDNWRKLSPKLVEPHFNTPYPNQPLTLHKHTQGSDSLWWRPSNTQRVRDCLVDHETGGTHASAGTSLYGHSGNIGLPGQG
ncbi:uncharacterized protein LOC144806434 [Lissotriton helveticus]